IKPTQFDPFLEVTYEFGFNLMTQEITGAGSMMTKWTDPFGIAKLGFVEPNSIIIEDAAAEVGVKLLPPPAFATISNIGFAVKQAKFFNLDFETAVSIAPLDKQVAIHAKRNGVMTMNDLTTLLHDGFGLNVKNIFPDDFTLENAEIKFAPTDAEIGEAEIEKGFTLAGKAKISNLLEGELDFHCDMKNEFYLLIDIESNFNDIMLAELEKMKKEGLRLPKLEKALNDFKVEKFYLELLANKSDMIMSGKCHADFTFKGKQHNLKFKATLDGKEIVKELIKELQKILTSEVVQKAAKEAVRIANNAGAISKAMVNNAKTYGNHSKHTKEHCDTKCVPDRAKELSRHIVDGSFDAVRKFYFNVFPELGQIKGDTPEETRKIRSEIIKKDWTKICNKIDNDWKEVQKDRAYVQYYTAKSSAENGGKLYRAKVKEYKKKEKAYRDKVWERMMTNTSKGNEEAKLKGFKIPKGEYYIKSVKAGSSDNGYFDISYDREKKKWKMKGQRLQIWTKDNSGAKKYKFHKNNYLSYYIITPASDLHFALDCKGRKRSNGTPIHLWSLHKGASQQFYFKHIGGGKFIIIPKSHSEKCMALKDNNNANKGNKVHLWTYSNHASKQWYLINVKTGKKFIPRQ
ncbi:MAG: RICIN domain-containing protein, partial [Bacteroidales bacterium]|nr:RICIN domain-containing protein [Bacteroidales bacterium]